MNYCTFYPSLSISSPLVSKVFNEPILLHFKLNHRLIINSNELFNSLIFVIARIEAADTTNSTVAKNLLKFSTF